MNDPSASASHDANHTEDDLLRTTTVRLDDDLLLLVQKIGSLSSRGTAEVIRDALRAYVVSAAAADDKFKAYAQDIANKRLTASRAQIEEAIGELLPDEPSPIAASVPVHAGPAATRAPE